MPPAGIQSCNREGAHTCEHIVASPSPMMAALKGARCFLRPSPAAFGFRGVAIGSETQQKRICQLSFVDCHLGARQVGFALEYFTRSERDQDRTGRRFAAAR